MEYDIANIFAIIANITYREYIRDIANIFAISNRDIVNVWFGVLILCEEKLYILTNFQL